MSRKPILVRKHGCKSGTFGKGALFTGKTQIIHGNPRAPACHPDIDGGTQCAGHQGSRRRCHAPFSTTQSPRERHVTGRTQALAPDSHWRQFISTNDLVGLKVNAHLGTLTGTRPAVVCAVAQSLIASGVPAKNIVIWDRNLADLQRAGYTPLARELGVQLAGSREVGFGEWDAYTVPALHWELAVGDHLFGKPKPAPSHMYPD